MSNIYQGLLFNQGFIATPAALATTIGDGPSDDGGESIFQARVRAIESVGERCRKAILARWNNAPFVLGPALRASALQLRFRVG